MGLLGRKSHTAGNTTIYAVDYTDWLEEGVTLNASAVTLSAAFTATVTDVTISAVTRTPSNQITFKLAGGSLNETFTLDVQATDTRGEIKKDTCGFLVVAP